jgi:hypothetical protein
MDVFSCQIVQLATADSSACGLPIRLGCRPPSWEGCAKGADVLLRAILDVDRL